MLKNLKISNYLAENEQGEMKRYYRLDQRIFLFFWRNLIVTTNYRKLTSWIKDNLDAELAQETLD